MRTLSFIAWFFLAVTSLLFAVLPVIAVFSEPHSAGPPAPLAGGINGIALLVAVLSGIVFALFVRFRPFDALRPSRLGFGFGAYAVAAIALFACIQTTGSQTIELRVLTAGGQPIPNAAITFNHSKQGGGLTAFVRDASGTTRTDAAGVAIIRSDRRHQTEGTVEHAEFTAVGFTLGRDWGGGSQQLTVGWPDPTGVYRDRRTGDRHFAVITFRAVRRTSLTLYMPRRNIDEPLPYRSRA